MTFRYTVICRFADSRSELPGQWLKWLSDEHLSDVLAAGATAAEVVHIDAEQPTYEVRYSFPSRTAFQEYEKVHAPRLREEGLRRFPLEEGLIYRRTTGEVWLSLGQDQ